MEGYYFLIFYAFILMPCETTKSTGSSLGRTFNVWMSLKRDYLTGKDIGCAGMRQVKDVLLHMNGNKEGHPIGVLLFMRTTGYRNLYSVLAILEDDPVFGNVSGHSGSVERPTSMPGTSSGCPFIVLVLWFITGYEWNRYLQNLIFLDNLIRSETNRNSSEVNYCNNVI